MDRSKLRSWLDMSCRAIQTMCGCSSELQPVSGDVRPDRQTGSVKHRMMPLPAGIASHDVSTAFHFEQTDIVTCDVLFSGPLRVLPEVKSTPSSLRQEPPPRRIASPARPPPEGQSAPPPPSGSSHLVRLYL